MGQLNFTTGINNSEIDKGLSEIKEAFEELYDYVKKKDFGEEFEEQIKKVNDDVTKSIDDIEGKIEELQKKIDGLRAKQKSALASGNGNEAGILGNQITSLVNERTELLKVQAQYKKYSDSVKDAARTALDFREKQEQKRNAILRVGSAIKNGAVTGVKALTVAVKAFMKIGIVALINAIITALTSFIKYLKSTEEGQRALAAVTGYLQGLLQTLKSAAMAVGKALFEAFKKVEPVVSALSTRVAGLVSAVAALVKITGAAIKGDWGKVKDEFQSLKDSLKTIWTGEAAEGSAADYANKQAKAYKELYAEREKLKQQREDWSEERAQLELDIARAEAKRDYATVNRLNDRIHKQELQFLEDEYAIEKKLVDLKPEEARTAADNDKLRDMRTAILEQKAANTREDARIDKREDAAENAAERRKQLQEQLEAELNAMMLENEQERLNLMEEGTRKEVKQLQHNFEKRKEEIRRQAEKWKAQNKEAGVSGLNAEGLTQAQADAIAAALELNSLTQTKALEDIARENREKYLSEYGTYKEKQLALTEKYDRLIAATDDEYAKKSFGKKLEEELEALRRKYEASYALIFADASALSDNLLIRAIEETQKAIKSAEDEGDIEKLAELYGKLRAQMVEQTGRDGAWGFLGIAKAFKALAEAREEAENATDATSFENALQNQQNALAAITSRAEQMNMAFSELGSTLEGFGGTLGEIGSAMNSLTSGMMKVIDSFKQVEAGNVNKSQAIATAISGTIELLQMVGHAIANNIKAQEEWNKSVLRAQNEYRLLQLEALAYKQQNIFGVENPYKKAIDGAKQYQEAMESLIGATASLANGRVQTGTKKAIDWGNVGKGAGSGAAVGAAIGSIIPGLGTLIGTAIGGAIGLIGGALSTKVVPVFENISKHYGQIIDPETLELNKQLVADYDILDDDTKELIDNWDKIKAKVEEAEEQMRDTFTELSGDIGGQLADSLVNAFRNGKLYSAIGDFHDKMTGTIESIIEQMVFSNVFADMFDELQKDMENSFKGPNADNNIVDDLMRFETAYQQGLEEYGEQMKAAQQYLRGKGYDAWSSDQRTASTRSALGASQDSVEESNARLTTIQGHTYELNENVKRLVAAAGLGDIVTPEMAGRKDYTDIINGLGEQLSMQSQQMALLAMSVADIQNYMSSVAGSTAQIEHTTIENKEMLTRTRSGLEQIIDSGIKVK